MKGDRSALSYVGWSQKASHITSQQKPTSSMRGAFKTLTTGSKILSQEPAWCVGRATWKSMWLEQSGEKESNVVRGNVAGHC